MGGGDQKLMMALGALVGLKLAPALALLVAVAGGAQALVAIALARLRGQRERGAWKKILLPYSVAILIGTAALLALHTIGWLPEQFLWR